MCWTRLPEQSMPLVSESWHLAANFPAYFPTVNRFAFVHSRGIRRQRSAQRALTRGDGWSEVNICLKRAA